MNNQQFRKLVLDTPARQAQSSPNGTAGATGATGKTPALGSRARSSIPMTPRSVALSTTDFRRQLFEQSQSSLNPSKPIRKFRSVAAPKGAKLPEGYVDRARLRGQIEFTEEEQERIGRVDALEEQVRLGQLEFGVFEGLRKEILGEELVGKVEKAKGGERKGLDFEQLERARRGEVRAEEEIDKLRGVGGAEKDEDEEEEGNAAGGEEEEIDIDDEFEKMEQAEIVAKEKKSEEKKKKKGEMAPPGSVPGQKRTRDVILAEMKAARQAAKEKAEASKQSSLGSKFKKVGEKREERRIETDKKGREVLVIVDAEGKEKRMVKKPQVPSWDEEERKRKELLMPDKDVKPLGMEVPEIPKPAEDEADDMDIFDGVGDDYDPLAGLDEDDDDSDAEEGEVKESSNPKAEEQSPAVESPKERKDEDAKSSMPPPPKPAAPRNYFADSSLPSEETTPKPSALSDPTILAAIKKASSLRAAENVSKSSEEAAKEAKRKRMLEQDDRDAQDLDMGFGSSRLEDEEDGEEKRIKLSEWGAEDDDEDEGGRGDKKRRKRGGGKKRKGDKDSVADVLGVLERRKEAGK